MCCWVTSYFASGTAEFDLLQTWQICRRKRLLAVASGLYAIVAQQEGHDRCIFIRLERAGSCERHGLRNDNLQLRRIEVRTSEAGSRQRRRRGALQVVAVANRAFLCINALPCATCCFV